jgi:hypothetical protein
MQQAYGSLTESNQKISKIWKHREDIYKKSCQKIKQFKYFAFEIGM